MDQHVGLFLDVAADGRDLLLGAYDGEHVGRHEYVARLWQVYDGLAALDGYYIGTIAFADVVLGQCLAS